MGGKQPKNVTQTNTVQLSPEQNELFNLALPYIKDYAKDPADIYRGKTIADFNANEVLAQQKALQAGNAGAQIGDSVKQASQFLLNPDILSPDSNPWLQQHGDAITQTMTRNLTESILPQIRSGATAAGGAYSGGSSREGIAQGLAIGRTGDAIGNNLTDLYSRAYTSGLSAMGGAINSSPTAQAAQLFGPSVMSQVGAQQRAMEQAKLDEAARLFLLEEQLPFLTAGDIMSLMQSMPGGAGVSTVSGATPSRSRASGFLGGAATGAALGSALLPGPGTAIGAGAGALMSLLG